MALSLIDKLTNYIMPVEEGLAQQKVAEDEGNAIKHNLKVHSQEAPAAKVFVASPLKYSDVGTYANNLKANMILILNFHQVNTDTQRSIVDFLNGVCYVLNGSTQRISDIAVMYVPANVDIDKEIYAYAVPTYVKE